MSLINKLLLKLNSLLKIDLVAEEKRYEFDFNNKKEKARNLYNNYLHILEIYENNIQEMLYDKCIFEEYYNLNLTKYDKEKLDNFEFLEYNEYMNKYVSNGICYIELTKEEYNKYKYIKKLEEQSIPDHTHDLLLKFISRYMNKDKINKRKLNKEIKFVNKFFNRNIDYCKISNLKNIMNRLDEFKGIED